MPWWHGVFFCLLRKYPNWSACRLINLRHEYLQKERQDLPCIFQHSVKHVHTSRFRTFSLHSTGVPKRAVPTIHMYFLPPFPKKIGDEKQIWTCLRPRFIRLYTFRNYGTAPCVFFCYIAKQTRGTPCLNTPKSTKHGSWFAGAFSTIFRTKKHLREEVHG